MREEQLTKNNVNLQDLIEEAIKSIEKMTEKEAAEAARVNAIELQEEEEDLDTFLKRLEEQEKERIAAHLESQKVQAELLKPIARTELRETPPAPQPKQAPKHRHKHAQAADAEVVSRRALSQVEQEKLLLSNELADAKKVISQINDQLEIQRLRFEEFLKQKEEQIQQLVNKLNQFQTEFVNYKRRMEREKEEFRKFSIEGVINQLLPVLDGLELAIKHSRNGTAYEAVIEGLEKVTANFYNVLSNWGVKPIAAEEQPFDPKMHEALAQIESKEYNEGIIVSEMQKGFTIHDRLLRPSKVVVAKNKSGN